MNNIKKPLHYFLILSFYVFAFAGSHSNTPPRLKGLKINASFALSFINSEGKAARAILTLSHKNGFSYKEIAGRGITDYIGKYEITSDTISLTNDNGAIRKFKYILNKGSINLTSLLVGKKNLILFNMMPSKINESLSYKKIFPQPLDFRKSKRISATYILKSNSYLIAIAFFKNFTYQYRVLLKGKKHDVLRGRYTITKNVLILENTCGRRFYFSAGFQSNTLRLVLKTSNFLFPFKPLRCLLFTKL